MLDRDTSPRKDPSTSLSGKKLYMVMTILHKEYSNKMHVLMKSFVYHSICMVFTILFVGSLSSHIYGLNCHYLYWNIDYIFIFRICGLYLAASKVSTFPCPLKVNNGSQWWVFWQKWRKVSTKKCLKTNLYRKRNFYPRYLSKKSSDSQFSSNRF